MRAIRRILQVVTFVGTLIVGILALALIVSQTPWFRDWLRRYIVRESKQYLNGELTIGGLDGNLLFGVDLSDVAVDVSGERVVAVKDARGRLQRLPAHLVAASYSIRSRSINPFCGSSATRSGWNVDADREAAGAGGRSQRADAADHR